MVGPYLPFSLLVILLQLVFCWWLALHFFNKIPQPKHEVESFMAASAQAHLRRLTGFGPRPAGSYANEVMAVNYLRDELLGLARLAAAANSNTSSLETAGSGGLTAAANSLELLVDVQTVSGTFQLDIFHSGLAQQYSGLKNVVARLRRSDAAADNSAIMINAHFDSVPQGPGASDDGVSCAVMLEILRVLITRPNFRPENDVIFLFNGAEESILPAAHGFITQHPWAAHIKAFLNVEAAGSGGRELLFQSGSSSLLQTYLSQAPFPFATVLAQEIFQSGLIPSDTDYRVFRDYGHLPGLDIAFIKNGFVYHTEHDSSAAIPLGSIQRAGDNLLAVTVSLTDSGDLSDVGSSQDPTPVFFDVLGLFMVSYPAWAGVLINSIVMLASLLVMLLDLSLFTKKTDTSARSVHLCLAACLTAHLAILGLAALTAACIAWLLGAIGCTLSWYSKPIFLFLLYSLPTISTVFMVLSYCRKVGERLVRLPEMVSRLLLHSTQLLNIILCLVLTGAGYNSGFVLTLSLLATVLWWSCNQFLHSFLSNTWKNFFLYSFIQTVPCVMWCYIFQLVFTIFIPIMGRRGTTQNPDIMLGLLTVVLTYIVVQPLLPLLLSVRRKSVVVVGMAVATLVTVLALCSSKVGFPYSGSLDHPSQKRMTLFHARRTIGARVDGGFLLTRSDYYDAPQLLEAVPELTAAVEATKEMCDSSLACGLPIHKRSVDFSPGVFWLNASVPSQLYRPVTAQILGSSIVSENTLNVSIGVSGPNWLVAVISPVAGLSLVSWSISPQIVGGSQWGERETFYLQFVQGLNPRQQAFWILLQKASGTWTAASLAQPVVDLALTGHHHHGQGKVTPDLKRIQDKIPSWVSLSSWTVDHALFTL